jgi:Phage terminase-like protein, large subunit
VDCKTHLEAYHHAVMTGKIIAGDELKTMLNGLVEDLQDSKYRYETTDAHIRILFMETLCLQSKKPFYMKAMDLLLWEKAFIEVIYSFQIYDEELGKWVRRFQDVLLLIARKNGKTTLLAADGHTDLHIGDGGMDIVCCSNDDTQASLLWNEINGMRERVDPKDKRTHKNMKLIENTKTNTKIFKLSSNTKNKDGRNIDKTYNDESHDAKNDEIAMACWQSMSVKEEPMFINLTTEGFVIDGYLDEKLEYARGVLNGEIDNIRFLPWLYTQDSEQEVWQDESSWYKSNPSLGAIKKWSYLRANVEDAKILNTKRIHVLCKDFNIKQSAAQSWLMLEDYTYQAVYNLEDFRGCYCFGAVDLAETTDLVSAKLLFMREEDKTKYIYTMYFIPESKLQLSPDDTEGAEYKKWAKDGYMKIHEGNVVDLYKVADWFAEAYEEYGLRLYKYGYDQRFAKEFNNRMEEYGFEGEIILQNKESMSNPMKVVEADFKSGLINYNENPVDRWCLRNCSVKVDDLGNCMPVKSKRVKRIDGAVALIILYAIYLRYRNEIYI